MSDVAAIRALETAWLDAIQTGDVEAAGEFLAEDYQLVVLEPTRAISTRQQWLDAFEGYEVRVLTVDEQVVEVRGDVAVVIQRVRADATTLGHRTTRRLIITDLWRRTDDGRWLVWRRQTTPVD